MGCLALKEPVDVFKRGKHNACVFSDLGSREAERSQRTGSEERQMSKASLDPKLARRLSTECLMAKPLLSSGVSCSTEVELTAQLASRGIGMACCKGRSAQVPNQDSVIFVQIEDMIVVGVADGSGECGQWASHWVSQCALGLLLQEGYKTLPTDREACRIFNILHDALVHQAKSTGQELQSTGCSLSLSFIDCKAKKVLSAWVGASMCVSSYGGASDITVLTQGVLPESEALAFMKKSSSMASLASRVSNLSSVEQAAMPQVTLGNPAIAHRLGALTMHQHEGQHIPCISRNTLDSIDFILCGSTGLWDAVDKEDAVSTVAKAGRHSADKGAEGLMQQVRSSWADAAEDEETDDVSLIVIWL